MKTPQLSIIVPVYNEADQLIHFFDNVSKQQNLDFELIICDGGSTDGTLSEASRLAVQYPFQVYIINCVKGRGPQMNAGADLAAAVTLLFLHVDSCFRDNNALYSSWSTLTATQRSTDDVIAGHFSLKFNCLDHSYPELFYHMECKARLDREECTHGDQGFMLTRDSFYKVGPFDNLHPMAEDTRFAERIRQRGRWLLFPELIETSARRFEVEGVRERQTFSAILMNFIAMDWAVFFKEASNIYQTQDRVGRLQLLPYLKLVKKLLGGMSFGQRLRFWYATGRYVRQNSWQIPFYFDTRYQYRVNMLPGTSVNRRLEFHDKWIEPLLNHPPGRLFAAILTWFWYRINLYRLSSPQRNSNI